MKRLSRISSVRKSSENRNSAERCFGERNPIVCQSDKNPTEGPKCIFPPNTWQSCANTSAPRVCMTWITHSCASRSRTGVPGWFPRSRPNGVDYNCEALGMHELPWRESSEQRSDTASSRTAPRISHPSGWKHSRPRRKRNYAREFIPHARYVP